VSRDWDARTYERVSRPQAEWAEAVLDRIGFRGDETVLDAGCGSGRVTRMLLERLPEGRVVAVDSSPSMVEQARQALDPERTTVLAADLAQLRLDEQVDLAFSNAVFHWVPDHEALFARMFEALRPGGRLEAQCGGEGNVERFLAAARAVAEEAPFAEHLREWVGPWTFQSPEATAARLRRAGFTDVGCWLEPRRATPAEPRAYLTSVCLGAHLEQLPHHERDRYVGAVLRKLSNPVAHDYVRLNIDARKPE
jgi:trans-aconitate 2-methyltransferase